MLWSLYLILFFIFGTAAYAGWRGAPWVPTLPKDIAHAVDVLHHAKTSFVIDLGCGTGSLLFALAKEHPHAELHGYDVSLAPLLFGWIRKIFSMKKYKNVHLHWKNLYSVDVSPADIIFVFMMPEPHTRIARTVLRNTRPESIVLFEAWPPEGFTPKSVENSPECLPLFVYEGKAFHVAK